MAMKISDQSWQEMMDIGDYWDHIEFLIQNEKFRRGDLEGKIIKLLDELNAEMNKKSGRNHYVLEMKYRELSEQYYRLADRYLYFDEQDIKQAHEYYLDGADAAFVSKREALIVDREIRNALGWNQTVEEIMEEYSCPRERVEAVMNGKPENESQIIDRAIAKRYFGWHQSCEEIAEELSISVERVKESFKMYRPKNMMKR